MFYCIKITNYNHLSYPRGKFTEFSKNQTLIYCLVFLLIVRLHCETNIESACAIMLTISTTGTLFGYQDTRHKYAVVNYHRVEFRSIMMAGFSSHVACHNALLLVYHFETMQFQWRWNNKKIDSNLCLFSL